MADNAVTPQQPTADTPAVKTMTAWERFYAFVTTQDFVSQVAPFFAGSETQAREFIRVVLNAVQKTPDLLYADRKSLLLSCMAAARDRLMPDGKKALLTVYRSREKIDGREVWVDKVEYQPMAAGMIQKMYDSGHVTYADACAVYEKDVFEYERGDAPKIVHKPTGVSDPGEIVAAYLIAKLKNGETKREVMWRRDIDRVHQSSKAPGSSAWKVWPDQMAIKAVVKRGYKQLPSTPDLDDMIARDNEIVGFSDFAGTDMPEGGKPTAVDAINAEVSGKKETPAVTDQSGERTVPPVRIEEPEVVAKTDKIDNVDATKKASGAAPVYTFADVLAKFTAAASSDELNLARDLIRSVTDPAHRAKLEEAAEARAMQLQHKAK